MPQQPYDYGSGVTVPGNGRSNTVFDLLRMAQIDAERMIEIHNVDDNAHPGLETGGDVSTEELAEQVSALNSAIALKQSLSDAATDDELEAASEALSTSISAVQSSLDAIVASGATDLELTAAVSVVNASLQLLDGRLLSVESNRLLRLAYDPDGLLVGVFTRDSNDAITSAPAVWPDGATGVFTATTLSTAFPGAIDAYTITHVAPSGTTTYTQSTMTRNANGAVTIRPAITVS